VYFALVDTPAQVLMLLLYHAHQVNMLILAQRKFFNLLTKFVGLALTVLKEATALLVPLLQPNAA
jgi:hypothetical protein